jgi:hypothetical protein
MVEFLGRLWNGFRGWPLWTQIPVGVFAGLFIVSFTAAPFARDDHAKRIVSENTSLLTTTSSSTTTSTSVTTTSSTTSTTVRSTAAPTTEAPRATEPPRTSTPTTAARAANCHPSYAGACVPVAPDVDCAGGSGNGPAYVSAKGFRVIGPDVYDLDRDGDGIACET